MQAGMQGGPKSTDSVRLESGLMSHRSGLVGPSAEGSTCRLETPEAHCSARSASTQA